MIIFGSQLHTFDHFLSLYDFLLRNTNWVNGKSLGNKLRHPGFPFVL